MKEFDSDVSILFSCNVLHIHMRVMNRLSGKVSDRAFTGEYQEVHAYYTVIRIFGIYTHAQLDKRFWDAVGRQLGGKGKEYKKR